MWSRRYEIKKPRHPLAKATSKGTRVNRHSPEHQDKVMEQVHRLIRDERAYRDRWAMDIDGEGERLRVERGVRRPEESNYAVSVCNTYLRMGPCRSFAKLLDRLQWDFEHGLAAKVPTLNTLKSWSRLYEWQARAYLTDHISLGEVLHLNMQAEEMRQRSREALERRRSDFGEET